MFFLSIAMFLSLSILDSRYTMISPPSDTYHCSGYIASLMLGRCKLTKLIPHDSSLYPSFPPLVTFDSSQEWAVNVGWSAPISNRSRWSRRSIQYNYLSQFRLRQWRKFFTHFSDEIWDEQGTSRSLSRCMHICPCPGNSWTSWRIQIHCTKTATWGDRCNCHWSRGRHSFDSIKILWLSLET